MEPVKKILLLVVLLALLTSGCYRSTTVILPPDSRPDTPTQTPTQAMQPSAVPTEEVTAPPTEEPTDAPTEPPTEIPTEAPSVPPTDPPTAPPTDPSAAPPTDPPATEVPVSGTDPLIYDILDALNHARTNQGLSPVQLDRALAYPAQIRADECAMSFSSTRPDGRDWSSALSDNGFAGDAVGEIRGNTSAGFPADILVDTWMFTDSSRNCLLTPEADRCGIGVARTEGNIYIVVIFAK